MPGRLAETPGSTGVCPYIYSAPMAPKKRPALATEARARKRRPAAAAEVAGQGPAAAAAVAVQGPEAQGRQAQLSPTMPTHPASLDATAGQAPARALPEGQDIPSCVAAIRACDGPQWEEAFAILTQMRSRGLEPDTLTYNAVMAVCEKGSQWKKVMKVMAMICRRSVDAEIVDPEKLPDITSYRLAIKACAKIAKWSWAVQLLDCAAQQKLQLDKATYENAITACRKAGQCQEAARLWEHMETVFAS